jgi:hypothetical protein
MGCALFAMVTGENQLGELVYSVNPSKSNRFTEIEKDNGKTEISTH